MDGTAQVLTLECSHYTGNVLAVVFTGKQIVYADQVGIEFG